MVSAYVGPQDLFLHWAQICLKQALILNINYLGMWKKGLISYIGKNGRLHYTQHYCF